MIIDIIVGAVLLVSAIIAFIRGFIREMLTIFGVLGGLVTAYFTGGTVSNIILSWIAPENSDFTLEEQSQKLFDIIPYPLVANILGYGGIFIVVVGLLSVISHFLAESLKKLGLGAVDRTLGVIFGLLRGALLLGLLYLPVYMLVEKETKERWFDGSRSHVYLEKASAFIASFLPEQDDATKEEIQKNKDAVDELFGTRETLQQLKVLKSDEAEGEGDEDVPGYNENFRQDMDKLFEEESDPSLNN